MKEFFFKLLKPIRIPAELLSSLVWKIQKVNETFEFLDELCRVL